MIPILFDANSTEFSSNGIGRLSDCTYCLVTEERNGIYECEFQYPIDGKRYADIDIGRIILTDHDEKKDKQPFVIYRRSAPISGMVTFNAHHISYLLSNVIVKPYTATNIATALSGFVENAITQNHFAFWTDKTTTGTFTVDAPTSCRALLGGHKGSVLDVFGGGDYKFDGYEVKLYANRGSDSGVTIRYGKNLTDVVSETDTMNLYTAIIPYWKNEDTLVYGGVVYGQGGLRRTAQWTDENGNLITDENGDTIEFTYFEHKVVAYDMTSYFDDAPTVTQLENQAATFLANNRPWIPTVNIKVDFVSLWQTEEYKGVAPLERVSLCDTVTVKYDALGVDVKARVIKTVWDSLLERYESIEIGDAKTTFADTIVTETSTLLEDMPTTSMMQKAIDNATDLITGGLGGNIVIQYDGNGKPTEILAMDTDDVSTAVHVLRINVNGIGFSSNGINGPYTSAWTLDGRFVADFITAGHMEFNILQGGTLTLGGTDNGNGTLVLRDANGNAIVELNNDGITINTGSINLGNGVFAVTSTGELTATNATINGTFRSQSGQEWININESVLTAGYGDVTHGILDVSAQTDNTYDVALEALVNNLRLNSKKHTHINATQNVYIFGVNAYARCTGEISLQTDGNVYLDGKENYVVPGTGAQPYPIIDTSGTDNTGKIRHLYRVTSSGTTYLGITNFSGNTLFATLTASDEKLKTNIEDAGDVGLEAINKIEHKSFDFIDGGYHRECGYIAQQLQEAIPYSTIAAPECDENGNQTGELLQIVDHEVLVYATKAIQELSAKVEELERRLQEV